MICIIFEKDDRKTAIQISKVLQSKGFKATLEVFSEEFIKRESRIQAAVLVFSQKSNLSPALIKQYDLLFDNDIETIPFVISDLEFSVSMQHFLNNHDWINAFDVNFNQAIEDLSILLKETLSDNTEIIERKSKVIKKEKEESKSKNQVYAAVGVGAVFVVVILFFIFGYNGKNKTPLSRNNSPEATIIGSWKLANYQDNMSRNTADYADFINSVSELKKNFLLIFNENFTFEKRGFSQAEHGNWQVDPQNMKLYMWPPNSNDKDELAIEKLTEDTLILVIATKIDSLTLINTKLTLYKE